MSPIYQRAVLLYQQSRYDLAAAELRRHLGEAPNDANSHALLALCLAHQEQFVDAETEVNEAITLAPDAAHPHYCRSIVMQIRNRYPEAEQAIREAIAIDPSDADYYGQLANALFAQRKWRPAHDAATTGLQYNPENAVCGNLRTMALSKLGDQQAALANIDEMLARHPDDARTHASKGWTLLNKGEAKQALEHFREALRLDPTLDYARAGMIEAIKARNPIYRWLLGYFLWMARLDSRVQWGIMVGGYFGYRALRTFANDNPGFAPYITPILVAYMVFALMTWFAVPLSNLLLRLSSFGRHALSRDQTLGANWFGGLLAAFIVGIVGVFTTDRSTFVGIAIVSAGMAFPLTALFNCDPGWPRRMMTLYSAALAVAGLGFIACCVAEDMHTPIPSGLGVGLIQLFAIGAFASQFVGMYLANATVRR